MTEDLVKRLRVKSNHPESDFAEAADAIERITRERDVFIREIGKWAGRAGHAEARVDELMAALRPFVRVAGVMDALDDGDLVYDGGNLESECIRVSHFRRARAVLEDTNEGQ